MTQKVILNTSPRPLFVEAEIIGAFAVHPAIFTLMTPAPYEVSHLFTGMAIDTNEPLTQDEARQFARDLMALPVNWYFGGASFADGYTAARPIVKSWLDAWRRS